MKRSSMSVPCGLVLLLAGACLQDASIAQTVFSREEQPAALGDSGLVLHFRRPVDWKDSGPPHLYTWNVSPERATVAWPGEEMRDEGNGWYVFRLGQAQSASVVFNNNPWPQTADLFRSKEGWYVDGRWFDENPDNSPYRQRDNATILQAFDWYIKDPIDEDAPYTQQPEKESNLWEYIAQEKAEEFYNNYFTHVWLPPTGKAFSPDATIFNPGYAVYDHYDLGEFDQMSHLRTKYGTRAQLHQAVEALHARKMKVIADVVMNQMLGTDNSETISYLVAYDTNTHSRTTHGTVTAFLDFDFANDIDAAPRRTTYSDFHWTKDHFVGMENYGSYYLFPGRFLGVVNNFKDLKWSDTQYNSEYQFLRSDVILGADIDLANAEVADEMVRWTKWLTDTVGFDGFRVDAVRHLHTPFVARWAREMRAHMNSLGKGGADFLMFGENWDGWNERLSAYYSGSPSASNREYGLNRRDNYNGIDGALSLFDVPLHYAFQKVAGENVDFLDIKDLPNAGLLSLNPTAAITFVDNHDTLPSQELASYININTKLQAYTYILLNEHGTPCVFYRDLYQGNYTGKHTNDHVEYLNAGLSKLLEARAKYAYGAGSYYGAPGLLGAKRSGDGRGHAGSTTSGTIALMRQFDRFGNALTSNTTLTIPDDGRNWQLFAGDGTRQGSAFAISPGSRYAVWVPAE